MKIGQIVYHKLTGQPLIIIEDIDDDYELEDNETLECRYISDDGRYCSEDFYGVELVEEKPVITNGPVGCGGNCKCAE